MNKNVLLIIAAVLIGLGLLKPPFITNLLDGSRPSVVVVEDVKVEKPSSEILLEKSENVIKALSVSSDRKTDGKKLAKLYVDIAKLISLDDADQVIKNTEEIRQVNRISGLMVDLDIKGKYPDLAEANQALVISVLGDDQVLLNNDLRSKAVDAFNALAWACYEGSK
jgi:hypothetical protein